MSLLFRIVYAAHANGTHHKLALDALNRLDGADADRWRNLFLKHVERYLEGSKAPDKTFKDFKNHVLHVQDDYWGGAPEKADAWYDTLVAALRSQAWSDAVYAAGVLSHYYTDPIQPFHTAQSEAESTIHRAVEWSISRSYDDLAKLARDRLPAPDVTVPDGDTWLKEMVCLGAETSNRSYEKLIVHYDIHSGTVEPKSGLDDTSRLFIAELLAYAAAGFARILDRAFAESGVTPPDVSLTLETFMASLQIPSRWIEKRLADAQDRAVVRAMYNELQATGHVERTLPEDDRVIRDLYELEVAGPRADRQAAMRSKRVAKPAAAKSAMPQTAMAQPAAAKPAAAKPSPAAKPAAASAPAVAQQQQPAPRPANRRAFLKESDDLEAAPSIGPRSAEWFADLGIFTVGEFLAADPAKMADDLAGRGRITADTLRLWQHQARLVIDVPGLRGTHAQLLAGAGYLDADAVAATDAMELAAAVLRFASTSEGQRILRQSEPPSADKIKAWVAAANASVAA